jgi:outer membrane protein TolC
MAMRVVENPVQIPECSRVRTEDHLLVAARLRRLEAPRRCPGLVPGVIFVSLLGVLGGCQTYLNDADREVYKIIEQKQAEALGEPHDSHVGDVRARTAIGDDAYAFAPNPVDPSVPEAFVTPADPPARPIATQPTASQPTDEPIDPPTTQDVATTKGVTATQPEEVDLLVPDISEMETIILPPPDARVLTLSEALTQAVSTGRDFQTAKEMLYLAVLDLTLERFLWTPQVVGDLQARFTDFAETGTLDAAMDAVSTVAVEQRLPYGGTVTAQMINSLTRDLQNHITTAESGDLLVEMDIPLLRGAGKVAYESRYQAEREVIYSVRAFERFRREYLVRVASDYFRLLAGRQGVINAAKAVAGFRQAALFEVARAENGRGLIVDARRAIVSQRNAMVRVRRELAIYQLAKDSFKILIGLPTDALIDVPAQSVLEAEFAMSLPVPAVGLSQATETALRYRLDLVTASDRVDDAKRGVVIARNGLLPDLNVGGSFRSGTSPDHLNSGRFTSDQDVWQGFIELEIPFQRVRERNTYRESKILERQAERAHSLASDSVLRDVRDARRQLDVAIFQLENEVISVKLSEERLDATIEQIRNPSPQRRLTIDDRLTAEQELREARDGLANQQSEVWRRILELRLATGTLRVDDDGRWVEPEALIR